MPAVRGQGQWALGYREPLNPNERMKKDSDGLDVRQRILDIYSKAGFDGIDAGDLRGRMRWMGLYTQRAQGIPGGKTALLEPEELEDSYFMLRVRIDGGQLSSDAAARDRRDQHRVRPRRRRRHRPAERAVALDPHRGRARRSGGGSRPSGCRPRRPAATPRASCSAARWPASSRTRSSTPASVLAETVAQYVGNPEFSNLPRKWKTSMSGCVDHCTEPEIDDVSFVGVVHADGEAGYDLWVGGGLSTNPKFAQRLGVFVRARPGHRRLGGVTVDLPRLRLPPAAQPRADQVPDGRLGPGEVPPGAAGRVPRTRRCPTARRPPPAEARPARPRRRRQAEGRRQRRRLRAADRPDQRAPC